MSWPKGKVEAVAAPATVSGERAFERGHWRSREGRNALRRPASQETCRRAVTYPPGGVHRGNGSPFEGGALQPDAPTDLALAHPIHRPSAPLPLVTLVLGGARSGKSRIAQSLVESTGMDCIYLATADAGDDEMQARIAAHRAQRGAAWRTVETPLALVDALREAAAPGSAVLVDCLTLWLSNLMGAGRDVDTAADALVAALPFAGPVVFVSNEVGLGIVPDNPAARAFRDHAGRLHQSLAAKADSVLFVAAGIALPLKTPEATATP